MLWPLRLPQVNEQANEIILSSDLYTLKKIGALLDSLDTPAKQLQSKSFTVKYLYLEEVASIVEENLSSLGEIIERNEARSMFVVKDTSYNLSKIEKVVKEGDIFIPLKKTYEIKFAPLAFLAEQVDGLLSDKGTLEIKEETFRFAVIDVKKNLDRIDTLVKKEDILERQLISAVQFEEESLRNVLNLLSDEVRINMFISPEVKGKVTLRLGKPIPFLEVLEAILTQNYCQYEIENNIIKVSKMPIFSESFSLEYALAPSIISSINALISSEGSFQLDEATNTIIVSDKEAKIEEIAAFIAELDTPAKQLQSKSFAVKYLYLEEVASIVEENLSSLGEIIERNEARSPFVVKDTSYNLSKIEKVIKEADIFIPLKRTYEIKFAPLFSLAEQIKDILSEEGKKSLETREETDTIIAKDVKKNLDRIDELISEKDTLEAQLITKRYMLKYLTPYEAKYYLEVNNMVSDDGKIRVPVVREKIEAGNVKVQSEYIIIPQEIVENPEKIKVESAQVDLLEEEENVIYITDLKRNIQKIDEAIKEMNGSSQAEEIITKTFYIQEGSLERMALAMANILGINPGDIEGLEPKGEWMQIEVPTAEINLGTLGPR